MSTPEKYFINQLRSHQCQLPPSDDFEYISHVSKLKNYFLISEKSLESYLKMKTLPRIYYEKRRQIRTTGILLLHPYSEARRLWDFWMCFVIFLAILLYPFCAAFHGPFYAKCLFRYNESFGFFYGCLYFLLVVQVLCLVDVVVNFVTGYVNQANDEIVIQPMRMARHYLKTYFLVDVISSLPIEFFLVTVNGAKKYSETSWPMAAVLSVLPLFKLFRVRTLYDYLHNIYGCFSSSYSGYNLVAALVLYFLILHWCGCFTMLVPRMIYYDSFFEDPNACRTSWLNEKKMLSKHAFHQYLQTLYLCMSCMVGVGFEIPCLFNIEDIIVSVIITILGKLYWIVLLVIFLQTCWTLKTGKGKFTEMMDQVEHYALQKKFPRDLRQKLRKYYIYMFRKEYISEKNILRLLSDNLQREIILETHQRLIEKVDIFNGLSQTLVYDIVSCLRPEIYLAQDVVFKAGDASEFMYFISFGTVAIYGETGIEVDHLHDGEYFGEISIILGMRRPLTALVVETTELYLLSVEDFTRIIKPDPTYLKMEKMARERYKRVFATKMTRKEPPGRNDIERSDDESYH